MYPTWDITTDFPADCEDPSRAICTCMSFAVFLLLFFFFFFNFQVGVVAPFEDAA